MHRNPPPIFCENLTTNSNFQFLQIGTNYLQLSAVCYSSFSSNDKMKKKVVIGGCYVLVIIIEITITYQWNIALSRTT